MLFVICISTTDSVRLGIMANLYLILLFCYAIVFFRVCISKHGCTSIGTHLCINALVLIRVLVFIWAALLVMTNISTCCIDVDTNLRITMSIYNGTGRFLRISDFCIPNSELRVPIYPLFGFPNAEIYRCSACDF